ncbi:MAG: hypothetical protein ABI306_09030 [Caulobacteraceae bacterium]
MLDSPWFRRPLRRRITFAVAALVLAVLCVWPRHYVAKADLMPQDSGGGLASLLNQSVGLVSLGALLGSHQSIEADLTIGRSEAVLRAVVDRLHLVGHGRFHDRRQAEIALQKKIDVSAIRGSILQVQASDSDPEFARALVAASAAAIQDRLTTLSLEQAAQKRTVADNRMAEATKRLADAQAAITRYRTVNRLAAPEIQLGAGVAQLASLQGQLQAKEVELQTVERFATGDNIRVQAVQTEVAGLRRQISDAQTASDRHVGPQLASIALGSSAYLNLYRDEKFAETLYSVYSRYIEEVTIDELTANTNLDVIEPPYVVPARQYNAAAVGLLVVVLLLAAAAEYYIIAPPVGRR